MRFRDIPALVAAIILCIVTAPYWLFFDYYEEDPEPHPTSGMMGEAGHD